MSPGPVWRETLSPTSTKTIGRRCLVNVAAQELAAEIRGAEEAEDANRKENAVKTAEEATVKMPVRPLVQMAEIPEGSTAGKVLPQKIPRLRAFN